jgi:hypothetical protein
MTTSQDETDIDESSGITTLWPAPVKSALLRDLADGDSTQFFSASELLERGKALAAQASEPAPTPQPTPHASSASEAAQRRPGWLTQFRRTSAARKASALLLPLLCVLTLVRPVFKRTEHRGASALRPSIAAPVVPVRPSLATPPPVAPRTPPLALARGVSLAHAAADSVATGDFARAAVLYRELARHEPKSQAYSEAARILGERAQAPTP